MWVHRRANRVASENWLSFDHHQHHMCLLARKGKVYILVQLGFVSAIIVDV